MNATKRCCIPNCTNAKHNKHAAFYAVKREWRELIKQKYPLQKGTYGMICGKHYRLCGIREPSLTPSSAIHFPYLKISISSKPRRNKRLMNQTAASQTLYSNEELFLDHEEVLPSRELSVQEELLQRAIPLTERDFGDHSYSQQPASKKSVKDSIERQTLRTITAQRRLLKQHAEEIDRLIKKNDITRKTIGYYSMSFREKYISENEHLLRFYTGFESKQSFDKFVDMVRPKFEAHTTNPGKDKMTIIDQLVLVLCKIRLGLLHHDLGFRYNISVAMVLQIWWFWIKLLYDILVKTTKSDKEGGFYHNQFSTKMVLECSDTLYARPNESDNSFQKVYSPMRGLLEVSPNGYVTYASDLFMYDNGEAVNVSNELKHIETFVKSCKILRGAFPNPACDVKQLNIFWKICCFLVNYIHKES